ncbi:MAG: GntR family transcriptional regulator [Gaiellaceae bacterium]|jgi:DNA-binding GntR family transcriptional regulator|nr:MAG: GntR family transcriptional regulator [Gaiellaceae bacterium]
MRAAVSTVDDALPISPLEERESVERRVAAVLRELIVSGQLREGTPLVHRELAAKLGVSPTPVRAGLGQLERDGLVVFAPNGRASVSRLTREDFEEIYAARLGTEGLAARLGAPAVSDAALAAMREMLERLRVHAARQELDEYLGLRWEFHATCYRSSGRTRLVDEVERLYRRSERYNRLVLASPERFRESVARYGEFLAACEARDGDAAERIIHTAMRWAVDRLAPTLPSERD